MGDLPIVVILNWNGRAFLRDCLRSILDQSFRDYRAIVVDNGSPDGSAAIVRDEFPEATLVALPENLHFARGMNAGIREALRDPRCGFVVALNNDTRVDRAFLEELVKAAEDPRVGVVAGKLVLMDHPDVLNSAGLYVSRDGAGVDRGWLQKDEGQFDEALEVFGASAGAALYRREVLETVGLFDEDFVAYYEDLDLAWRARLAGFEGRFAPRAVVLHKYSASYGSRVVWKTRQGERNRIWNFVQNYPWGQVAAGIPWNAARVGGYGAKRVLLNRGDAGDGDGPGLPAFTKAWLQGRLEGYAGLSKALQKRKLRNRYRKVDAATIGRWLRDFGVAIRDMPGP